MKKIIKYLLATLLCFTLVGCGSSDDDYIEFEESGDNTIADIRSDNHKLISSGDEVIRLYEGYYYPNGNRNAESYFKVERDTLTWYVYDENGGDMQIGDLDGLVSKLGKSCTLKSGIKFEYKSNSDYEKTYIQFEDDDTKYYLRNY